jgi:hypothetical protein
VKKSLMPINISIPVPYAPGGLPQNGALTIYAYPDIKSLIEGESKGGLKAPLPGLGNKPCTEQPDS